MLVSAATDDQYCDEQGRCCEDAGVQCDVGMVACIHALLLMSTLFFVGDGEQVALVIELLIFDVGCNRILGSIEFAVRDGEFHRLLADWRYIRKHQGDSYFVGSGYQRKPVDEKDRRIQELEAELRETKRANEILKDALGFFAESRKK